MLSLSACSAHELHPVTMTTPPVGSSQLVPGGVPGTVGAFVDMLSRHNYVYMQPYVPAADGRAATGASDQPTAATGSFTDLLGRVAALPESQTRPLSVPASSVPVIVSRMGTVTPSQPVTMFRIFGGSGTQPQQIVAYRHRSTHADQQPVLLPASAVRPTLAVHQPSPFVGEPALFAHQLAPDGNSDHAVYAGMSAARCGELDVVRVEAEAHELTHDASGHEIHRCRLCARIFTVMAAFRSHVLTAHCRPKNQCVVCGKHFSRSWLLKGHMRTHTGERPYRCPHVGCDRAFADKSNLRSHLMIHNNNGKHYVCSRCNRAFAQKRYLHKHRLEVCKI